MQMDDRRQHKIRYEQLNQLYLSSILKFKLDRKSLEIIYTTFIRPILEYGDVIWDTCTQYEKQELDKIQTEAAKIELLQEQQN